MNKLFSVLLVVFVTLSVLGSTTSKNGLNVSRTIAMERINNDVNMLKPPSPPPAVFPQIAPNDPLFKYQWSLDDNGRVYTRGTGKNKVTVISNHGIQAQKAWKTGLSGLGVKIAILWTGAAYENYTDPNGGIYYKASDLGNFAVNEAKDFTVDPPTDHANDWGSGTGTSLCSIIAAATNNNSGMAGIAYKATILPIKIVNTEPKTINLSGAINWAVTCGADIIFIPSQTYSYVETVHQAIINAYNAGIVIICSGFKDVNGINIYPAAFPECIAVGATRFDGTPTNLSSYGDWLDIVAPGGDMTVDQNVDGYMDGIYRLLMSSTDYSSFSYNRSDWISIAGAHVTSVAALILEKHPDWTPDQVRTALINSAKHDVGITYPNASYGHGLVDAFAAVSYTP